MVDQIRLIVIATGFDDTKQRLLQMARPTDQPVIPAMQVPSSPIFKKFPSQQPINQEPAHEEDPWDVPAFLRQKS